MKQDTILLAHGSGGSMMHKLIGSLFAARFSNPLLDSLDDSAIFELPPGRVAFSTDTYVVHPIRFKGGNIGKLAVCGTVNDLAAVGATPKYLSAGFVLEEGLSIAELEEVLDSMVEMAAEAGVSIVTGDTKVVERGGADKIFINTAGVGVVPSGLAIGAANCKAGDKVLLSGTLGDHGIAVVSEREGLAFETAVESDCAPLNGMVESMLAAGVDVHALRDPTRGGLASTLNEFASASGVGIRISEESVPVRDEVLGACEMLGYDVFHVANEGKMVAVVAPEHAAAALEAMRASKYGADAAVIGEVAEEHTGKVLVDTSFGSTRILDMLVGEQLPRIC
ncbi:MAG: hydrogenase expression/formation protein HypE [Actinobacteria bacterium]|nr:MAG: hydrogenase expression/formation protein HypE [Actinomycetota bacterium]